jgi:hypothetical protein
MKKIASEIRLCPELWKYRSKRSLPQNAQLRYQKSRISAAEKIALHRYWKASFRVIIKKICDSHTHVAWFSHMDSTQLHVPVVLSEKKKKKKKKQ